MKTQSRVNLHFSGNKTKSHLFRVDKQFLKELRNGHEMVIEGQPTDQVIITSASSCFRIKGIHISTTILVIDQQGTILQQSTGYLDAQKFTPQFNQIYKKIVAISHNGQDVQNLSFSSLLSQYGFTKEAIKKQCYLSDQQFEKISKAMNLIKILPQAEQQTALYLHIGSDFLLQMMRQIIKVHNEQTKNLLQPLPIQKITLSIPLINMSLLNKMAVQFDVKLDPEQHPNSFQFTAKSILLFILYEMASAKKHYASHTFDEVLEQMLMVYMPFQAQVTISSLKESSNSEMKQLFNLRYLLFIDNNGEKYTAYDYMEVQTDITKRLKFLGQFKNRWNYCQLKAILRGVDSTENGKFLTLSDVLLKKFRKYGDQYEIKFILPTQ